MCKWATEQPVPGTLTRCAHAPYRNSANHTGAHQLRGRRTLELLLDEARSVLVQSKLEHVAQDLMEFEPVGE